MPYVKTRFATRTVSGKTRSATRTRSVKRDTVRRTESTKCFSVLSPLESPASRVANVSPPHLVPEVKESTEVMGGQEPSEVRVVSARAGW